MAKFFGAENVKNVVLNVVRIGARGMNVVAEVSMDNQLDKAFKHMVGRIVKRVAWYDRPLVSYSGDVNAKADTHFDPQPRKGFKWLHYPLLEAALKSGVEYLTFSYRWCDKGETEETYYLDGVKVDKKVVEPYFKPKKDYTPKTQLAVGVSNPNDFTRVVRYELERIVYIGYDKAKAKELFND